MAAETGCAAWQDGTRGYKTLALEHKLAAKRGNFFDAYSAMDLLDKDAAMPKSNGERTGPAMVRPLLGPMLELAECVQADGSLNEFAAVDVLRRHGTLAKLPEADAERQAALDKLHAAVVKFAGAISMPEATVRDVLAPVLEEGLFDADLRLVQAYGDTSPPPQNQNPEARKQRRIGAGADGALSSALLGNRLLGIAPILAGTRNSRLIKSSRAPSSST